MAKVVSNPTPMLLALEVAAILILCPVKFETSTTAILIKILSHRLRVWRPTALKGLLKLIHKLDEKRKASERPK